MSIDLAKQNEKGTTYQADGLKILYRKEGSVSGDNSENPEERLYLITGSAQVTLEGTTWRIDAPARIDFPARTYHKIVALTDISLVMFENPRDGTALE